MSTITLTLHGTTYPVDNDPDRFTAAELNAVERYTGMTVREWGQKLADPRLSALAWTALAWLAVRRAGHYPRWDDFEESISVQEIFGGLRVEPDPEPQPEPDPKPEPEGEPEPEESAPADQPVTASA